MGPFGASLCQTDVKIIQQMCSRKRWQNIRAHMHEESRLSSKPRRHRNNRRAWSANRALRRDQSRLKLQIYLSTFKRPKRRVKMAVQMLLLPAKATTEETANTCTDQPRPRTTEHDELFNVIWSHASRHIIIKVRWRGDKQISNGQGSLGHWHLLQLPRTLKSVNCCHAVSSHFRVCDARRVALLVKQGTFPIQK